MFDAPPLPVVVRKCPKSGDELITVTETDTRLDRVSKPVKLPPFKILIKTEGKGDIVQRVEQQRDSWRLGANPTHDVVSHY